MIILIDVNTQNILLYRETGLISIPFSEAGDIVEYIGNKKVPYVTNAINVGSNDVINLINSLGVKITSTAELSNNKYIHAVGIETIYIDEKLKFEGKYDCILIDQELKNALQENVLLKSLVAHNKLEIIGEAVRRKIDKEHKKVLAKKIENHHKAEEKLNSIIMDKKVEDWDGSISTDDHKDIIEIDIDVNSRGKIDAGGGVGVETMSELLEKMGE